MAHRPCKRMTVYATGIDKNGNVLTARNGNPGTCTGIPGACGCQHAEYKLLKRMPNPVSVFVTHSPCIHCARLLVKAGVRVVAYFKPYRLSEGIDFLEANGVKVFPLIGKDFVWEEEQ